MRAIAKFLGVALVAAGVIEVVFSVRFMIDEPDGDLGLGRAGTVIVGGFYAAIGLLMVAGGVALLRYRRSQDGAVPEQTRH